MRTRESGNLASNGPQSLQDVQAVAAAEGPEVEDHHATAQAGQAQRFASRRLATRGRPAQAPGHVRSSRGLHRQWSA